MGNPKYVVQGLPYWYVSHCIPGRKVDYTEQGDNILFWDDNGMCNGSASLVATIARPFPGAVPVCRESRVLSRAPYTRMRLYWEKP
jgi:hypothetical protein